MVKQALIALGSNLENPRLQIKLAFEALSNSPKLRLIAQSSLYVSAPQGPQDQPDFVNAAALVETTLSPSGLLSLLQSIEDDFGRIKTRHWGERIIDLDIAFMDKQRVSLPHLEIPHPRALERDFVVLPCLEIAPNWRLPDDTPLSDYRFSSESFIVHSN